MKMNSLFALISLLLAHAALANVEQYRCTVSDKTSGILDSVPVEIPVNTIKEIELKDSEHKIEFNNYDGQLFINIGTLSDRLSAASFSVVGSYGSALLKNPPLSVSCYGK